MSLRKSFASALFVIPLFAATLSHSQTLAPTPPMGWNSWDAYGLTIDETDFKANVSVLAGIKRFGWKYAVIDEGWYMADPFGHSLDEKKYLWNENGILIPVASRFPDAANGAGFKPLADWVHVQGLQFGIHIIRGIPRQVVAANLPIAGTSFHAEDAADKTSPCPWDDGNWGIKDNAAGQAYYDSMIKLYAGWGLDYIKVDCISDRPWRPTEIHQIAAAIKKTGRPIVLSLSPGPTSLKNAAEVGRYSQLWRISDDHWDVWKTTHAPGQGEFPVGVGEAFDRLAQWVPYVKPGNWPDMDMLPWGWLGPHPGLGEARQSRETHDEQQTEFTLWAIARSPLILGANLTRLDDFTRSLITNPKILAVNQESMSSAPVTNLPAGFEDIRVWRAEAPATDCGMPYFAFFNLADTSETLHFTWDQIGGICKWPPSANHTRQVENLWNGARTNSKKPMTLTLAAHGSAIFQLK